MGMVANCLILRLLSVIYIGEEFTDLRELQPVLDGLGNRATLYVIAGADHSYDLPGGSGRTKMDALSEVASVTAVWMRRQLQAT